MKQTIATWRIRDKSSRMVAQLHGASSQQVDPRREIQRDVYETSLQERSSGMVTERHGASSEQRDARCGLLEAESQILFCREW